MKCKTKTKIQQPTAAFNLYDLNKSLVDQLPAMSDEEISQAIKDTVIPFVESKNDTFYMLLCREASYFTLLQKVGDKTEDNLSVVLMDCLKNFSSDIRSIDYIEGQEVIEIWTKGPETVQCMYLFPYDNGLAPFSL